MALFGPMEEIMSKIRPFTEKNNHSSFLCPDMIHEKTGDRTLNIIAQKVAGIYDIRNIQGSAVTPYPVIMWGGWTQRLWNPMDKSHEYRGISRGITDWEMSFEGEGKVHSFRPDTGTQGGRK